jgi:hypothetical protein
MTTRISLLSAALAIGTLAALPALAQTMTPASPAPSVSVESGVHADTAKSGVQTDAKTQSPTQHKAKDKAALEKKRHEQVAQHPGAAAKTDGTVKSDIAKPDASSK